MTLRYLTILLYFVLSDICAQTNPIFEKVDMGSATDMSIVSAVTQDQYGYIWAATEEGLLKYNGNKSYLYNEYLGLPESFSNKIQTVYVDPDGNIWATSDNKLAKYDPLKNEFHEIAIPNISIINKILFKENYIWLAAYNGLWKFPVNEANKYQQLLKEIPIFSISDISTDMLLIGTRDGSLTLDTKSNNTHNISSFTITSGLPYQDEFLFGTKNGKLLLFDQNFKPKREISQCNGPIYDLLHVPSLDFYYVGVDGDGIYILDDQLNIQNHNTQNANDQNSLTSDGVYDLHLDDKDQMWVATYGGGINKFSIQGNPFSDISHIANESQSIINSFTRSILETQDGNIWYGTKAGISIYDPKSDYWQHISTLDKASSTSDIIMSLADDGDFVWVGTYGKGAYRVDKNTLQSTAYNPNQTGINHIGLDKIYSICKSQDGRVWFGGIDAPVESIDQQGNHQTYNVNQIREIKQAPDGRIYMVGRGGVFYLDNGEVKVIKKLSTKDSNFDYSTINCINFQNTNTLWIGTNGDGIIRYNTVTDSVHVVNVSNGMPSDIVQGIVLLNNELWASTSRGLVHFSTLKPNPTIEIFDQGDGIKSIAFNYGSYASLSNGDLAFGSTNGVIILDPLKIKYDNDAPTVMFESFEILNSSDEHRANDFAVHPLDNEKINLTHKENFINIRYAGIDQKSADKIRYSWRMVGVNDIWSNPTKRTDINFAGLTPGHYEFQIKALNRNNVEGNINTLPIRILPPWWASKWAYILYSFLILVTLMAAFLVSRRLLKQKNSEEQISFYNNITHELKTPLSILLTKLEHASDHGGSIGEVKSTVHRLNGLFDQLLNFNKVSSDYYRDQKVSKINFTKHINLIVDSFKPEIEKLNISFSFDNQWPHENFYYKRDVLDKITYNLISNAVKYSNQGGAIHLIAKEEDGKLSLTVKDNGIGIPKDQQKDILKRYYRGRNAINSQLPGTGLGLMIVKNLVEYDQGEISFTSEEGLGTAFNVVLHSLKSKFTPDPNAINESPKSHIEEPIESSQKAKILIVEDNDELRIDLVEKLSEHYSIMAARNGKEGLHKAQTKLPDLIITDLIMPEMDGNQLCIALQKNEDTNHIPVFMMTVLNSASQQLESIKSGVTTYMTKPIDFPFLIAKINSTLEYKQKLREKYLHDADVDTAHKFKDDRDADFIKQMEDFIIDKIKEESISVQDLCKHMGMSRTALYMKLKDMIDMSLQNFIISTKMNHARKLLLQGGVTVKEVAFQVGFTNPKYFSTSFKKQFGDSPSGFLKSLNP